MGLFSKRDRDTTSSVVEYLDKKTRLMREKYAHKKTGEHVHYFSKREIKTKGLDPRCKICGLHLSELTLERKLKKLGAQAADEGDWPGNSKDNPGD